jgi:hypothetical protein
LLFYLDAVSLANSGLPLDQWSNPFDADIALSVGPGRTAPVLDPVRGLLFTGTEGARLTGDFGGLMPTEASVYVRFRSDVPGGTYGWSLLDSALAIGANWSWSPGQGYMGFLQAVRNENYPATTVPSDTGLHVARIAASATGYQVSYDHVDHTPASPVLAYAPTNPFWDVGFVTGQTSNFRGSISAVIAYAVKHTNVQQNQVVDWLNTNVGVATLLKVPHYWDGTDWIDLTGAQGPQGVPGPQGATGATGATGPPGPGVAPGGSTGQVLTKTSATDYATGWQTPTGGGGAAVHIGPDAPPTPAVGQLWWRNDPDGNLFIYYDDGSSSQFVPAAPNVGPPGPPGPSQTVAYRHVQATAATVWTITHNLTFRPNVAAIDSTGREMWPGAVDYPSAIAVTLTFSAAVGGEAYLS